MIRILNPKINNKGKDNDHSIKVKKIYIYSDLQYYTRVDESFVSHFISRLEKDDKAWPSGVTIL